MLEGRRACWPRFKGSCVSSEAFHGLAAYAIPTSRQSGEVLFIEGQPSHGVFILASGRVKLFTASADGKIFVLKFASPGEILGLAGTLSYQAYEASAEAVEPTQIGFVERRDLVHVLRHDGEVATQVAVQLSESYCSAITRVRTGLLRSASQKVAVFLLDWCDGNSVLDGKPGSRNFTHEEIAQAIGISRETVSRILSRFKQEGLIQSQGCTLELTNRSALERSAAS
jgi:CRP/FNR family transcriptional regulator, cyclic AMP receptor protein